jgi:hypothetical protein
MIASYEVIAHILVTRRSDGAAGNEPACLSAALFEHRRRVIFPMKHGGITAQAIAWRERFTMGIDSQ